MRLRSLGGERDIGTVARRAQRDRKPDAAAAAGDEQRLAFEGCHLEPPVMDARNDGLPPPCGGGLGVRGKPQTPNSRPPLSLALPRKRGGNEGASRRRPPSTAATF